MGTHLRVINYYNMTLFKDSLTNIDFNPNLLELSLPLTCGRHVSAQLREFQQNSTRLMQNFSTRIESFWMYLNNYQYVCATHVLRSQDPSISFLHLY